MINAEHLQFIVQTVGVEVLSDQEREMVDLDEDFDQDSYIDYAFKFGMLSQVLNDPKIKKMSFSRLKQFIASGNFIPLTQQERSSLNAIKLRAYSDIKGLGNRVQAGFTTILIEVDQKQRNKYEKTIKKEISEGVAERETLKQVASRLGHATADWSRDFGRIADYVMHSAFDQGRAQQILKDEGPDSLVYKDVYDKACSSCIDLYLTAGPGSEPKKFKLIDLLQNGSNIGVKKPDWKPVIGSTHPWCRCTLNKVPSGLLWDQKARGFITPDPNWQRKFRRNSKVNVTIGDKKYTI
ncbi:MAG: hypothetical protein JHC54_05530 [Acinetobacter sp.]|nr:hypothetical protein [Acinetobacter sp.]